MDSFQQALGDALDRVTPQLPALLEALGDAVSATAILDDEATEQFLRAFVTLLEEAIEGGREHRELVLSTAVPALLAAGESSQDLVASTVAFLMGLQPRFVEAVPPEHREAAAIWLARFAAEYVREVLEAASA